MCEYTGILRRTEDVENVSENNFIFEIDCLQTMKGLDGREVIRTSLCGFLSFSLESYSSVEFVI